MTNLWQRIWKWLVAALGGLVLFAGVYLIGRRTRKGDLNLGIALHELERVNKKAEGTQIKLTELRQQQANIAADIVAAQVANDPTDYSKLSDSDIDERLRQRGLIK